MNTYLDIYAIRLKNLELIIDQDFCGNKSKLAEKLNRQASSLSRYWSLGEDNYRRINDKAARSIEKVTGRPINWMDNPHVSVTNITEILDAEKLLQLIHLIPGLDILITNYVDAGPWGKKSILTISEIEADRSVPAESEQSAETPDDVPDGYKYNSDDPKLKLKEGKAQVVEAKKKKPVAKKTAKKKTAPKMKTKKQPM